MIYLEYLANYGPIARAMKAYSNSDRFMLI